MGYFLALSAVLSVGLALELGSENFAEYVGGEYWELEGSGEPLVREWFVMFYAPWCGYCTKTKPLFMGLEVALENDVTGDGEKSKIPQIGLVNCDENRLMCHYFSVDGLPTLLYITHNKQVMGYNGPRNIDGFLKFIHDHNAQSNKMARPHPINIGWTNFFITFFLRHPILSVLLFFIAPLMLSISIVNILHKPKPTKQALQPQSNPAQRQKQQEGKKDV